MVCAVVTEDARLGPLREILSDDAYQKVWPAAESPHEPRRVFDGLELLFLAALILAAIVLVVALVYRAVEVRRLRRVSASAGAGDGDASPPDAPGEDLAAALAAEGRFTEAIHALFLRALSLVLGPRSGAGPVVGDSLTAREVVRSVELDEPSRASLLALLRAVERSVFGGRDSSQGDYEACVRSAHELSSRWSRSGHGAGGSS